jgi:hypothetical protein
MGKLSASELDEKFYNNYRAIYEGDEYEYHAVSVRQAWYLAFEHFGDECLDYLAEIDQDGNEVNVILDKEDEIY